MDFLVLGPLEARRDGVPMKLGALKQRSLLALLLVNANRVVSTDRIIDELWGDQGSGDHQNSLWVNVSNLRSALEPDRERRTTGTVLRTMPPGYLLTVGPDELDADRFEALVREGKAMVDDDPGAASLLLGEALALWRGHAYEEFTYDSFAQAELARLEEVRLEAVEARLDADLRRGLAAELVGELESLVRQHPLREGLTADLMLALYRSGRQADALRAYQRLRSRLAEDLGIAPSSALQRLEERALLGDPSLDVVTAVERVPARLAVRGYELREPLYEDAVGTAYRAYQPAAGCTLTVKVVRPDLADDPSFIRRFDADAEQILRLEHPHIVRLRDYWREPEAAYLTMDLDPGPSLAAVSDLSTWTTADAARVVAEVGSALALAHGRGIVHGGVNPHTVSVDGGRGSYLTGFAIGAPVGLRRGAGAEEGWIAPEVRQGTPPTTAADIYGLGRVLGYLVERVAGDGPGAASPGAPLAAVIDRATAADRDERHPDVPALLSEVAAALGTPGQTTAPPNPYKGLRAFEEPDAPDFFGRERLVERLLVRLGHPQQGRFVALVGPSGSGKSSTVHAGLVPALRRGALPGSEAWFVVAIAPGRHPFEELEAGLLTVAVRPPPTLLDQLTDGEAGIKRAVARVLPDDRSQLLLVLDQLEELFTQAPAPTAKAFLTAVASAVTDPHSRLRIVATLRADYYDHPLRHRTFGELLRLGTEVITPMSPAELELVIDRPSERLGVHFEPGLVAQMVADVSDREGALPLLQYALTELFDHRHGSMVTLDTYAAVGGVSGALVRRAEALYDGFEPDAQETTRQLLLRLVAPSDAGKEVRRRVSRRQLTSLGHRAADTVIDAFGHHRLLTFDRDPVTREPTVEIAHEALLTEWHRLHTWIDESRDDLRLERRLVAAADEWAAAGEDPAYLLEGPVLEQLDSWASTTDLQPGPREHRFLAASSARRDGARAEEERRRTREERLRRQARRRNRLLVVGTAVLAVVVGLSAFAVSQRNDANRAASQLAASNDARRLASAATSNATANPRLAMLLALQSLEVSRKGGIPAATEAEEALHWALQAARVPYPVTTAPAQVRFGPHGPTGIFALPLGQLVDLARVNVRRTLTADECRLFTISPCPTRDTGLARAADGAVTTSELPLPPAATTVPTTDGRPLAGTSITVVSPLEFTAGLRAEIDRFETATGVDILYQAVDDVETLVREATASGKPPDLAFLSQPGAVVEHRRLGRLIDLSGYVDVASARRQFGDYLIDLTSVDGGLYGLPVSLDLKGLVWYPVAEFEQAGYTIPETWDELMALSRQMVAAGQTPWCLGFEDGSSSGSAGTDWIEGLALRTGGVDLYDSWASHRLRFYDPAIREAALLFGTVAFSRGFARGGPAVINASNAVEAAYPMLSDPPGCWLSYGASSLVGTLTRGTRAGADVSYFPLPPLEVGGPAPLFGGGSMVVAFTDRPEVRKLVEAVQDPGWGTAWAAEPSSQFVSANLGFDPVRCRGPLNRATADVRERICREVRDLLANGAWRFDASDQMPPLIGGLQDRFRPGAFYQGMVDYLDGGPESLARILGTIEAAYEDL